MTDKKIKFNDSKSAALVACKKTSLRQLKNLPLVTGDASVSPSASLHNLGVTIDRHLTMQALKKIQLNVLLVLYHCLVTQGLQ
jgi:hypothetical protein